MSRGSAPASGDDDLLTAAGWDSGWSLTDVLASYQTCDVFARYLVEHGAGLGTYHAALFGYVYLNQLRYLAPGAERDQLVSPYLDGGEHPVDRLSGLPHRDRLSDEELATMFEAVCDQLGDGFQRFTADMGSARSAAVSAAVWAQRMSVTFHGRRFELHASELCAALDEVAMPGELEAGLAEAVRQRGIERVLRASPLLSLVVSHDGHAFELAAVPDVEAVRGGNSAILARLEDHRDTCCYLQLDGFVMVYDTREWDPLLTAFLQLCCLRSYGQSHPGVVERIGALEGDDRDGDYFVVHCPTGQDPAAVRAEVGAAHPHRKIVIHPF